MRSLWNRTLIYELTKRQRNLPRNVILFLSHVVIKSSSPDLYCWFVPLLSFSIYHQGKRTPESFALMTDCEDVEDIMAQMLEGPTTAE